MRVLILGASGGVGRWLTRFAAAEHNVTAFVRHSTAFAAPAGVSTVRGSVLDAGDLSRAVAGQDVVISCIGSQRVNPKNPWSPLRPPLHVAETTARGLVSALHNESTRRVVAISAAGVGDGFDTMNAMMQWMVRHSTVGQMYEDLDAMERVFRASRLDWLAVRPVTLINAAPSNRTKVLQRFGMMSVIGRADLAAWLLRAAVDPAPIVDRTPMIGWW